MLSFCMLSLCVLNYCCMCKEVIVLCVRRREEEEEKEPGIQNEKQEPHTKLWGTRTPHKDVGNEEVPASDT